MTKSLPKEGIIVDKLMKIHMGVVIGVLAFTLGLLGFFLVRFVDQVNMMDQKISTLDVKINTVDINVNVMANDVVWIKNALMNNN